MKNENLQSQGALRWSLETSTLTIIINTHLGAIMRWPITDFRQG
jgi:hypothetical protein